MYDIQTKKGPKLLLKGTGDLKGSSIGHKDIEFTFVENQEENVFLLIVWSLPQVRTINYDEKRGYGTMNNFRQYALCIGTSVLILLVSGCSGVFDTPEDSKETQIKKSFAKTLDMYPIKNLEDLYDKEGYRDGEFKRETKGRGLLDLK